jgi:hypothetical protein
VYGSVRIFKEEKGIVGTKIEEVKDHNEVTNHFLQIFVSSQSRMKGTLSNDQLKNQSHLKGGNMVKLQNKQSSEEYTQTVLDLITEMNRAHNQNFCHKTDLWTVCQNKMTYDEFINATKQLLDDGSIYTGIDDEQFGLTE